MRAIYRTSQFRDRGVVQVFLAVSHSGCAQKTWGILLFFPDLLQCARSGGKEKEYCVILFFSVSLNCEIDTLRPHSPTTPGPLPLLL